MIAQRINKAYFPEQRLPERFQVETSNVRRHPFKSNLLEEIFKICEDPNFTEVEYLTQITGMNVHQIHTLCKQHRLPLGISEAN